MSEDQILRLTPVEVCMASPTGAERYFEARAAKSPEYRQALDAARVRIAAPVSLACAGDMHMSCLDWENCGCPICHKVCQNPDCQRQCRALYRIESAGLEVCASCYKTMAPPVGRTTYCEECNHPAAYRHPGKGDDRFLCSGCHITAGHLTRQDRHDD